MAPEFSRRREKIARETVTATDPEVLDLAHLARYTAGNHELEDELLRLFRAQLRTQVVTICQTTDAEAWRFATHTLKGVARSIGATAIARTAERLEQLGPAGRVDEVLETLETQITACEREIDRIIDR